MKRFERDGRQRAAFAALVSAIAAFALTSPYAEEARSAAAPRSGAAPAAAVGLPEFQPKSFVPGQAVTAYVLLDAAGASWHEESLTPSQPKPSGNDAQDLLSVSIKVRSGMPLLAVRFIAWRPGRGQLPSVTVGGLVTPGVPFSCGTALADGNDAPPVAMGQLEPEDARLKIYLSGGAVLALGVALFAAASNLGPALRALKERRAFAAARKDIDRVIAELSGSPGRPEDWSALCASLRRFVGIRTGIDWIAITSGEAKALPQDAIPGMTQPEASEVLAMGDRARFAVEFGEDFGKALTLAGSVAARIDDAVLKAREAAE